MPVTIGALRESAPQETRVSLVPEVADKFTQSGARILLERGAGARAQFPDAAYKNVAWADSPTAVLEQSQVVLTVQPLSVDQITRLKSGTVVIGYMQPYSRKAEVKALQERGITSFAMEFVPRISRAQSMDALSSQANVAGYAATLLAATEVGRFFPMMTTAAGTVAPARVLGLGAGVAGLQAIATAKRLGAVVSGFDIRRAAWEQIASLGGRPLELDFIPDAEAEGGYARPLTDEENEKVREALAEAAARQDVIITTALVPGRPAPLLITADAVRSMQPSCTRA